MYKKIHINLPPEVKFELKELSAIKNQSINYLVTKAIKNYLLVTLKNRLTTKKG